MNDRWRRVRRLKRVEVYHDLNQLIDRGTYFSASDVKKATDTMAEATDVSHLKSEMYGEMGESLTENAKPADDRQSPVKHVFGWTNIESLKNGIRKLGQALRRFDVRGNNHKD